ncbi:BEN domain-containing protein 4 isoform X2 [Denticeps clupeoides]|uniref:BEN domain-containing protein 4 isoform X2 n=1 Tax=Denticeps clupeoides TaxID=299321 RepID=UPI0010A2F659|nr:BEN domain-containing protein 4 isoform X2 [Denticeps clupeoides]
MEEEEDLPPPAAKIRRPYSSLKTFPGKRASAKPRYERPTMVDIPQLHHPRVPVLSSSISSISSSSSRQPRENRPCGRVSTSADHRYRYRGPPTTERADCSYGMSKENRLVLDAFAQQCSRVLSLLNNNGRFLEPRPAANAASSSLTAHIKQEEPGGCRGAPGTVRLEEDQEDEDARWNQQQTSALLRVFTESLQNYLLTGAQASPEPAAAASPGPSGGGWASPAPSESYGHPSSTLPEEEEEEENCCPRCTELEQEVLSLQQENEELRNKLDNVPAPCQSVLDFFKAVLQHHNQFLQPPTEEQLTEQAAAGELPPLHHQQAVGRGRQLVQEGRPAPAALSHSLRLHHGRAQVLVRPGQAEALRPFGRDGTRETTSEPCQSHLSQRVYQDALCFEPGLVDAL